MLRAWRIGRDGELTGRLESQTAPRVPASTECLLSERVPRIA
jgi:hypothetical protein